MDIGVGPVPAPVPHDNRVDGADPPGQRFQLVDGLHQCHLERRRDACPRHVDGSRKPEKVVRITGLQRQVDRVEPQMGKPGVVHRRRPGVAHGIPHHPVDPGVGLQVPEAELLQQSPGGQLARSHFVSGVRPAVPELSGQDAAGYPCLSHGDEHATRSRFGSGATIRQRHDLQRLREALHLDCQLGHLGSP